MHRSARGALALLLLLLLIAPSARAQAPVPSGFVDAATVVDGLVLDMRYFSENNFVGEKIDGYERARCLLSAQAANALAGVQRGLAARGLGLKVFDCYRPQRAVAHFVRWARKIDDVRRKAEFYPEIDKRVLFKEGYISEHSGHSRGATLDLTLVRRADGSELDMGGPFDFFSRKSWPSDKSVSAQAQKNRALLADAMTRGGFRPYDKEWWHFTLAHEPFPHTYFDFPVR
jgi:D-alanyl-D-alanine dipeptidase